MSQHFKDPYTDKNGVLLNKTGAKDYRSLNQIEANISMVRAAELESQEAPKNFDFDYLKSIHKQLFSDIYEWAGETRSFNISKGPTMFCLVDHMENFGDFLFRGLAEDRVAMMLKPRDVRDFLVKKLAYYFGEINALHPFREGNGRTQKLFIDRLARVSGLEIDWSQMTMDELIRASIESATLPPKQLEDLIGKHSRKIANG